MESTKSCNEEAQAQVDIWKYIYGFSEIAVIKCAVDLGIPDVLEDNTGSNGGSMSLFELSSALGCSQSSLYRIMRYLTHHGVFKEVKTDKPDSTIAYAQTALSRLLLKNRMAAFFQFTCSPVSITSLMSLSKFLTSKDGEYSSCFEAAHGKDFCQYVAANPSFNKVFHDAMGCQSRLVMSAVIENCTTAFEGIGCLVDVGGGDGSTLRELVKVCPWIIRAINFDLPHVVTSSSNADDGVEHVGGDMFVAVPRADAAFIMSVLHNWDDEACAKILKNCREAIPKETGRVIIVDAVVDDDDLDEANNKYGDIHLILDIKMMSDCGRGKQRTAKEWANVFHAAGFAKHTIKHIPAPKSVIVAYP